MIRGEPEMSILDVVRTIDRTVEAKGELDTVGRQHRPEGAVAQAAVPGRLYLTTRGRFLGINPALSPTALREVKGVAFRDTNAQVQLNPTGRSSPTSTACPSRSTTSCPGEV